MISCMINDTTIRMQDKCTPLHYVRSIGVADALIKYGAEVDAFDKVGRRSDVYIFQHVSICTT